LKKGMAGFSVGQKIRDKTGMRASNTAELVFDHVKVPAANLVGKEGDSMMHMMRNLELERLTLAAMSVGIARRSLEVMNRYATEREAFGKPLNFYGQIQKYIADSYAEYKAAKTYVYDVARKMDLNHEGNRLDSDGAKLVATTMGKKRCRSSDSGFRWLWLCRRIRRRTPLERLQVAGNRWGNLRSPSKKYDSRSIQIPQVDSLGHCF
jgi:isovaleryl-CoA dehydrogenase